jgi:hypothetical protein
MRILNTTAVVPRLRLLVRVIAFTAVISTTTPGCDLCFWCHDDELSASEVFWQAFTDPEGFDSWLANQEVDSGAAKCLRSRSERFFTDSQNKRRECSQMQSGGDLWRTCTEEAEGLSNGSVVARDLATTIEGSTRFAGTNAGTTLIAAKAALGPQQWQQLVSSLRNVFPKIEC